MRRIPQFEIEELRVIMDALPYTPTIFELMEVRDHLNKLLCLKVEAEPEIDERPSHERRPNCF